MVINNYLYKKKEIALIFLNKEMWYKLFNDHNLPLLSGSWSCSRIRELLVKEMKVSESWEVSNYIF